MQLPRAAPRIATADTRRIKTPLDIARSAKQRAPIYGTPEFKVWREIVIKRAGRRCELRLPGCGGRTPKMYADHTIEINDGGDPFDPANGKCACAPCHGKKTEAERKKRAGIDQPQGSPHTGDTKRHAP